MRKVFFQGGKMSKLNLILIFSFLSHFIPHSAQAKVIDKVIYGEDNRLDIYQSPSSLYRTLAASSAAMIPETSLVNLDDQSVTIKAGTLQDDGICADEKFSKQPTAAMCSGFLVAPNLLVTAGHCITQISDCETYVWVFDYANTKEEKAVFNILKKDIYKCTKIISRTQDPVTMNDYALVQLDHKSDRTPLMYRKTGKISDNSELVVIGHPSGLPAKISDGAFVRQNTNKYFLQANLDTFGGNSGSAVFNTKTGIVEGILVRGEEDYVLDNDAKCMRPKICKMDECRGEDVTRITNIKELK
jgi:V8-like Glu-specific endopeptidase